MKFIDAYHKFKEKDDWKFSISFYYHDENGAPMLSIESDIERIVLDHVDGCGFVITILTKENSISFIENNWSHNVGNDYVTFCSKTDSEIYWVIEFC